MKLQQDSSHRSQTAAATHYTLFSKVHHFSHSASILYQLKQNDIPDDGSSDKYIYISYQTQRNTEDGTELQVDELRDAMHETLGMGDNSITRISEAGVQKRELWCVAKSNTE